MGHTPGPWQVRNHPDFGHLLAVIAPQYRKECDANHVVCELRPWQRPDPDPNARLISAAPDLLSALKDAYDALDYAQAQVDSEDDRMRLTRCRRKIKPVIDKAEGRSE